MIRLQDDDRRLGRSGQDLLDGFLDPLGDESGLPAVGAREFGGIAKTAAIAVAADERVVDVLSGSRLRRFLRK